VVCGDAAEGDVRACEGGKLVQEVPVVGNSVDTEALGTFGQSVFLFRDHKGNVEPRLSGPASEG